MAEAEPRWLDDREREAWLALVAVVMRLPAALDAQLQRDAGLTHYDYLVMVLLSEQPGRTCQLKELAAASVSSLSRLSHEISKLERQGWVLRARCQNDRRATNATLTAAGLAKLSAAAPGHVEEVRRRVFDLLGPDRVGDLGRICSLLAAGLVGEPSQPSAPS